MRFETGILRGFPRERAVIINADGGSRDGTPELVTGMSIYDVRPASNLHALRTLHSISTTYSNGTGAEAHCEPFWRRPNCFARKPVS